MFGLFKKEEPVKAWGDFRELDQCNECDRLEKGGEEFYGICPSCGSRDIKQVVGRWLTSWKGSGLISHQSHHKYQIREGDKMNTILISREV